VNHKRFAVILAILVALAAAGGAFAMSSPGFEIPWQAESTGGGDVTSSANYTANYTVGQTATSTSSGTGFSASLGYWQEAETTLLPYVAQ
jgi:hypothetical protein